MSTIIATDTARTSSEDIDDGHDLVGCFISVCHEAKQNTSRRGLTYGHAHHPLHQID